MSNEQNNQPEESKRLVTSLVIMSGETQEITLISSDKVEWYILDESHRVHPVYGCNAVHIWSLWNQNNPNLRRVAETWVGSVRISTVFLGMDHGWPQSPNDPYYKPVLFETMVFGGFLDNYQMRYTSWDDAQFGHVAMTYRVQRSRWNPSNYLKMFWQKAKGIWRSGLDLLSR